MNQTRAPSLVILQPGREWPRWRAADHEQLRWRSKGNSGGLFFKMELVPPIKNYKITNTCFPSEGVAVSVPPPLLNWALGQPTNEQTNIADLRPSDARQTNQTDRRPLPQYVRPSRSQTTPNPISPTSETKRGSMDGSHANAAAAAGGGEGTQRTL
jgi:hypothetical protein